jgi:hypothetical protein
MFTAIENLPGGAVGFEAHGRVSGKDRLGTLEPQISTAVKAGGKVRLLYVAASDFDGYEHGGAFDEAVFGTRHFHDFERIAFVAEEGPYARSVAALDGLMPANLRVFAPTEIVAAKAWLAAQER